MKELATRENTTYTIDGIHMITKLTEAQVKYFDRLGISNPDIVMEFHRQVRRFHSDDLENFIKAKLLLNIIKFPKDVAGFIKVNNPSLENILEMVARQTTFSY